MLKDLSSKTGNLFKSHIVRNAFKENSLMFFRKVVYLQTSLSPIRGPKCTFQFFDSKRQKNKRYPFCLSTFAFLLLSYGFGYSWLLKEGNFPCQSQLTNSNTKSIVQWDAVSARRASPMLAWLMFSQAPF